MAGSSGTLEVVKLAGLGPYDNNVYLLVSGGEALLVDSASEADRIIAAVAEFSVRGVVMTHNHPDHTAGLGEVAAALSVPVMAHPADAMPVAARSLHGGERIEVGAAEVLVLHTPGHTPGSLCYLAGDDLLSGDTLFPGGPGNTSGDSVKFGRIMQSLDESLFTLPDSVRIRPGHGADSTIGTERPHLEEWRTRGW